MVRDLFGEETERDLETLLEALHDEDCRTIIKHLTEPMTADEIAETTEVPLSTTYRKLDSLTDAGLVAEGVEIRSNGQHASRYMVAFDGVSIELTEDMEFAVDISEGSQNADERLVDLWSAVQQET